MPSASWLKSFVSPREARDVAARGFMIPVSPLFEGITTETPSALDGHSALVDPTKEAVSSSELPKRANSVAASVGKRELRELRPGAPPELATGRC
jgi:hypothetical protein